MKDSNVFSLVVWNSETAEVRNGRYDSKGKSQEEVSRMVEKKFQELKVLHVFKGTTPSKSYRSLPYDSGLDEEFSS